MKEVNISILNYISLLGLFLFLQSCHKEKSSPTETKNSCPYKNQLCDSALFTLINSTQDTIFYGIGTNMWEDTLLAGQQRSYKYGKVKVSYNSNCEENRESWSTHQLSSNWGEWAFNIDHCEKRSAFQYTDASKSAIKLYDATQY